tara:strand:- start:701 stop:1522 length:822 start_codon:yes stop_codon:yes gene_type:complete
MAGRFAAMAVSQPSRKDLSDWATHACGQRVTTKLETECSSGVVYCKLLDAVRPGAVDMTKLKDKPSESENLNNFRVLQSGFEKLGISQTIDVAQLARGQPQATLEMLQKLFALKSEEGEEVSRGLAPIDPNVEPGSGPATRKRRAATSNAASKRPARPTPSAAFLSRHESLRGAGEQDASRAGANAEEDAADEPAPGSLAATLKAQLVEAREALRASRAEVSDITEERDFYFDKLERIEVAAEQADSGEVPASTLLLILHAEEEEAPPADDEE